MQQNGSAGDRTALGVLRYLPTRQFINRCRGVSGMKGKFLQWDMLRVANGQPSRVRIGVLETSYTRDELLTLIDELMAVRERMPRPESQ